MCGIPQSSVSRLLIDLEARLKTRLFDRDTGRLVPTERAVSLAILVDEVFDSILKIDQAIEKVESSGRVTIAATPTLGAFFLMPLLSKSLSFTNNIKIDVESVEMVDWDHIFNGKIDIVLTPQLVSRPNLSRFLLHKSYAVCIMPENHQLTELVEIDLKDLIDQPMVSVSPRTELSGTLENSLEDVGANRNLVSRVATSQAAVEIVRGGHAVAIINPFPALCVKHAGLVARPLRQQFEYKTWIVCQKKSASDYRIEQARNFLKLSQFNKSAYIGIYGL